MSTATDTSALEREIIQQVYALYRLKPEQIAFVVRRREVNRRLRFAPAAIVEGTTP